ncbi:hypothetical protein PF010_g2925 [Phytophthora fragariae]|uniref:Restriction endonuclease domain-containing protein n=1 Tax=Phytophthora fragariae TaxID=53985 RepID=A0A6G0P7I7_9STRA|nr:hypothetical protein PF010_g2925 [Phytophthora fragariae]KAE9239019.1 hypothetical protein PF004_g8144 [Phytophthora fragariae]
MAVTRINREVAGVDLTRVRESPIIPVCAATRDEWREYANSDDQAFRSKCMEWIEGTIYIVEVPSQEHEAFNENFKIYAANKRAFLAYMKPCCSSTILTLPDYEADSSFGPRREIGAPLPTGVQNYRSWRTLVVEVGLTRGWGDEAGSLDWKAQEWARLPGVRYILCVSITDGVATAEYKLYTVERDAQNEALPLPDLIPVPVVGPRTLVTFDSRELLSLPPGANIPRSPYSCARFPNPTFSLDLFVVFEWARRSFGP